jgi:pyruvate carboxylase subunit B
MMDDAMWGMILGKSGKIPGTIAPELVELAKQKGKEFTDADPHTLLENALPSFIKEMEENGWDRGQDDEELYELAMHPEQYRNYKSGQAKRNFLADLQKAKDAKLQAAAGPKLSLEELSAFKHAKADAVQAPENGQVLFEVTGDAGVTRCIDPAIGTQYKEGDTFCYLQTAWGQMVPVPAALGGKLVDITVKQGQKVLKGQPIGWLERDAK